MKRRRNIGIMDPILHRHRADKRVILLRSPWLFSISMYPSPDSALTKTRQASVSWATVPTCARFKWLRTISISTVVSMDWMVRDRLERADEVREAGGSWGAIGQWQKNEPRTKRTRSSAHCKRPLLTSATTRIINNVSKKAPEERTHSVHPFAPSGLGPASEPTIAMPVGYFSV
jgi:hypothetical protein